MHRLVLRNLPRRICHGFRMMTDEEEEQHSNSHEDQGRKRAKARNDSGLSVVDDDDDGTADDSSRHTSQDLVLASEFTHGLIEPGSTPSTTVKIPGTE